MASLSLYREYVGGLVSDCYGRLGQDDMMQLEVEEEDTVDEFEGKD